MALTDWHNEVHALNAVFVREHPSFAHADLHRVMHWGHKRIACDFDFDQLLRHEAGGPEPDWRPQRPWLPTYEQWLGRWHDALQRSLTATARADGRETSLDELADIVWWALEDRLSLPALVARITGQAPAPPPPGPGTGVLAGRLRVDGRFWRHDRGDVRVRFASCLAAVAPGKDARPLLDQLVGLGFTGVRVFAGNLTWAGQTAAQARTALPFFLEACRRRGLYVEITILTDTRS